ncbi:MAG TPA: glucosamine-6-phosphate deaminase [Candidatus Acidoferrum sp.]|nr:glucosamine-6-phosphate deaminase [Candidatus Acidoferrum sp.]
MKLKVFAEKEELGKASAAHAARAIRNAISDRGLARIIAATGASQFDFLDALTTTTGIDWQKVELFHLDEYIGLPMNHPTSFCKYLQERLIAKTGITRHHLLNGTDKPAELIRRVGDELKADPIDVAFVGIGENGHLAFNDPPADFETKDAYIIVNLDEDCRRQQVGEGWFANLSEVPKRAISMSVRQILTAKEIIAVVPDARKAKAVKACIEGPISPMAPASILRMHPDTAIYLDGQSASLLSPATLSALAVSG